jgi:hypothetical protein
MTIHLLASLLDGRGCASLLSMWTVQLHLVQCSISVNSVENEIGIRKIEDILEKVAPSTLALK